MAALKEQLAIGSTHSAEGQALVRLMAFSQLIQCGWNNGSRTILLIGAASLEGMIISNLARALGIRILGTGLQAAECAYLSALGLNGVLNHAAADLSQALPLPFWERIDLCIDLVGDNFARTLLARLPSHCILLAADQRRATEATAQIVPFHHKAKAAESILQAAGITMNEETMEVHYQGRLLDLKRKEYLLLKKFMEHPDKVFTRDELLNEVWGYNSYPATRTVDNHIVQLRKKIAGHLFQTMRGAGYRLKGQE